MREARLAYKDYKVAASNLKILEGKAPEGVLLDLKERLRGFERNYRVLLTEAVRISVRGRGPPPLEHWSQLKHLQKEAAELRRLSREAFIKHASEK